MAARGAHVTGIDLADKPLKVAQLAPARIRARGRVPRKSSAEDLARSRAEHYDVVTCMELLEHVPDPAATVRACATLAKPDGWLFFATINRNREIVPLRGHRRGIRAANCCRAARTITRNSSSLRSWQRMCRDGSLECRRNHRHDLQPAHPHLLAGTRHGRELHSRRSQTMSPTTHVRGHTPSFSS